ncbi:hypothetical protein MFIFM68171_02849 [Madurella fahalii]|uniref:Uncharacterized protein n=1 Tax=Madurella fahalii TaxID=1157608 RepID=A0ABQ0G4K3_9PEZI
MMQALYECQTTPKRDLRANLVINQTWFFVGAGWRNAEGDVAVATAVRSLHGKIGVAATAAGAKLDHLFMNDANV